MNPHFPVSSATIDAFVASQVDRPQVYLIFAAVSLVVALRFAKRALAPVGALMQAAAAAAVVAVAIGVALVLVAVAAFNAA